MRFLSKITRSRFLLKAYELVFKFATFLPAKKYVIMFESYSGKQYSCNPRAIYEHLQANNTQYKMYWSVNKNHTDLFKEQNIPHIKRFSIKWLFYMARAEYWISNSRLPLWIPKPKHTTYLQTWHGTPLKKLGLDIEEVHMPGTTTDKYKRNFLKSVSKWDFLISPNSYSTNIFRGAFQFNRQLIESGYPRNDFLVVNNHEKAIRSIKAKLNIPENKKVILYAPTWRDNDFYAKGRYKFKLELDLDKMTAELGDDYIVILRMHYLVAENLDLSSVGDFARDYSDYVDIRELYLIADLLITDYSSVFFDYAILKRPMLFFAYDFEEYRDKLRGFYFDFESKAPGLIAKTTEEIIREIKRIEEEGFIPTEAIEAFYQRFCNLEDGKAAKRVVDEVFNNR